MMVEWLIDPDELDLFDPLSLLILGPTIGSLMMVEWLFDPDE